jgi:DNA-binding NtrC family response regulator
MRPDSPTLMPDQATTKLVEGWPDWSILIVDDEPGMRNFLVKTLVPRCHDVQSAGSAEEGTEYLRQKHFDLIVLDISLPGQSGVNWLKKLRELGYRGCVILITAFADLETAIEALRAGASDFILKPFRVPQILNAIKHCFDTSRMQRENYVLKHTLLQQTFNDTSLVGESPYVVKLRASLPHIAASDSTVLLQGESGTGKELVARVLHNMSARSSGPFVPLNCACISTEEIEATLFGRAKSGLSTRDGLFYYAQGGTLFLDEVAELPPAIQAALLRALEEVHIRPVGSNQRIPVNVRIMAATNRQLKADVAAGRFRADLYYRLQVIELTLEPLRQHDQDIPALVSHFLQQLCPRLGVQRLAISELQMNYLRQYHWPGNVRELRNLLERSVILGELNVSALYSPVPTEPVNPATTLQALERQHMQAVLDSVQGDKTRAAELLGISRRTLERRCSEWASQ